MHPEAVFEKIYIGKTVDVEFEQVLSLIQDFSSFSREKLKEKLMGIVYLDSQKKLDVVN